MHAQRKRQRPISRYDASSSGATVNNENGKRKQSGSENATKFSTQKRAKLGGKGKPVSLKNQVRSLERLLKREGLSKEKKQQLKGDLRRVRKMMDYKQTAEREAALARKYHKVKFFERVKIDRRLKQLRKQNASKPEPSIEAKIAEFEDWAKYVKFFPAGEKYISVFVADESNSETMALREKFKKRALKSAKEAEKKKSTETAAATEEDQEGDDENENDDFFVVPGDEEEGNDEESDDDAKENSSNKDESSDSDSSDSSDESDSSSDDSSD